ncbi:ribosomal protein S18-alanine N-acetyltransferase [Agromyces soli]
MSVLLRRATVADLEAIMRLERATFEADAWPEEAMRRELESEHGHYLVAVDGEADASAVAGSDAPLRGYAGLLAPAGSGQGDIQTIAVDPAFRGAGLGRALMLALLAEARRRGAELVFLEVRADNPVARGLYASLGFAEIGVRPRYYRGGIDAVLMRLDVAPLAATPAEVAPAAAAPTVEETR